MIINYKKKIKDEAKFRYTNPIWNNMGLNHPSKVGMVSQLIQNKVFESKEDWANYYFESGRQRWEDIMEKGPSAVYGGDYGRTREELIAIGEELYQGVLKQGNPLKLTKEECIDCVAYRVIGETYDGIILREENTIKTIQELFDNLFKDKHGLVFKKTLGSEDAKYAVDYEVFSKQGNLILGLQIKPSSYRKPNRRVMGNIHEVNLSKNKLYFKEKGVGVEYVYSNTKGVLDNPREVIDAILEASKKNLEKNARKIV